MVRKCDRSPGGVHIHIATGLLELDHAVPEIKYESLLNVPRVLNRNEIYVQQKFKRMIFNVPSRNRDNYTKNHAFQMAALGEWGDDAGL
jgi:serine/threonine-protein kinase HipA